MNNEPPRSVRPLDIKALYGYPSWEDGVNRYWLLPGDGVAAVFPIDMDAGGVFALLERAGLMRRFDFHTNEFPLKDGLALYLTSECNSRCAYCEADIGSPATCMDAGVINAAFEFAAWISRKNMRKRLSVTLLGGEPTLYTASIIGLLERLKLARVDATVSLCTNGALSDADLARLLPYENVEWRISLDVPGASYSGMDYRYGCDYSRVIHTIRAVADAKRAHAVRCTVTRQTLPLMSEMVSFCESLGAKKLAFTPIRAMYGHSRQMAAIVPDAGEYIASWFAARRASKSIEVADSHFDMLFGKNGLYCSHTFIMPDGTILPTISEAYAQSRLHAGNVTERAWPYVESALNRFKKAFLAAVDDNCGGCAGRHVCGGGAMATELYLGSRRQGMECRYLQGMIAAVCARIHALLPAEPAEELAPKVKLVRYNHMKDEI